ncbi:MAG TPA: glycoside hydrolase family 9 protein, partial [Blastocatellia bacterium]
MGWTSILSLIAGLAVFTIGKPGAKADSAFIRINQLGYVVDGPKRAYLMSRNKLDAAGFSILGSAGGPVLSANVGTDLGGWGQFHHVYALDFDSFASPGLYTITVNSGGPAITSPAFKIDTALNLYSVPLAKALSFYQAERDGPDFIPSALRTAPGHLNDANAIAYKTPRMNGAGEFSGSLKPAGPQLDASGGWWDAGDYLKFVETHSYAVAMMLVGIRDFPDQMGAGPGSSGQSDFTQEAAFGLNWLQKMWDDSNSILYYQVGVGEVNSRFVGDHDIWRLPQADDTMGGSDPTFKYIRNRPVFAAGPAGSPISPNLAGRMAADFALAFQVLRTTQPDLATQWLLSAEHIFDLADTNPKGRLLTAAPFDSYPETEWRDDLELGAAELYYALASAGPNLPAGLPHTDPAFYVTAAANWANAYITGPNDDADTLNLYDVSGLAHFELYRAITSAGNPPGLAVGQPGLLADIKKELDGAVALASTD